MPEDRGDFLESDRDRDRGDDRGFSAADVAAAMGVDLGGVGPGGVMGGGGFGGVTPGDIANAMGVTPEGVGPGGTGGASLAGANIGGRDGGPSVGSLEFSQGIANTGTAGALLESMGIGGAMDLLPERHAVPQTLQPQRPQEEPLARRPGGPMPAPSTPRSPISRIGAEFGYGGEPMAGIEPWWGHPGGYEGWLAEQGVGPRTLPGRAGSPLGGRTTSIIDRLLSAAGEDIGRLRAPVGLLPDEATAREQALRHSAYLGGEPFRTEEEQAMVARAKDRVRNDFNIRRQQAIDQAGAYNRPLGPMLDEIDRAEHQQLNEIDREILVRSAGERRSRFAEQRGVLDRLGAAERGREELGFRRGAESRGILGGLESLERARQAEALGIESMMDEQERRRIMDLLALVTGAAPQTGEMSNISGNLLNYAGQLGRDAGERSDRAAAGLGDLFRQLFRTSSGGT